MTSLITVSPLRKANEQVKIYLIYMNLFFYLKFILFNQKYQIRIILR